MSAIAETPAKPAAVHIDPDSPKYPLGYWNWITFAAADFDRSAVFYDRILGFMGYRRTIDADDFIMWQTLFGAVALKPAGADRAADARSPGVAEFIFFAPAPQDVDRLAALLRGTGVRIIAGPRLFPEMMEGMYGIFFADPDGTRLGLVHQPANFP
jgi:catechol 2,3-dioxygenase-like lactoylglutathione lyase family enzyme